MASHWSCEPNEVIYAWPFSIAMSVHWGCCKFFFKPQDDNFIEFPFGKMLGCSLQHDKPWDFFPVPLPTWPGWTMSPSSLEARRICPGWTCYDSQTRLWANMTTGASGNDWNSEDSWYTVGSMACIYYRAYGAPPCMVQIVSVDSFCWGRTFGLNSTKVLHASIQDYISMTRARWWLF